MASRRLFSSEEDVALAETLIYSNISLTSPGSRQYKSALPVIRKRFVQFTKKFGVDGTQRTERSLENRIMTLRQTFQYTPMPTSRETFMKVNARRIDLLAQIFYPETSGEQPVDTVRDHMLPRVVDSCVGGNDDHNHNNVDIRGANQIALESREERDDHSSEEEPTDSLPHMKQHSQALVARSGIEKKKSSKMENTLKALCALQKQRMGLIVRREKTIRIEEDHIWDGRKWINDMLHGILQACDYSEDSDATLILEAMKKMYSEDVKMSAVREESLRGRLENDRMMSEMERSTFEKVIERFSLEQNPAYKGPLEHGRRAREAITLAHNPSSKS